MISSLFLLSALQKTSGLHTVQKLLQVDVFFNFKPWYETACHAFLSAIIILHGGGNETEGINLCRCRLRVWVFGHHIAKPDKTNGTRMSRTRNSPQWHCYVFSKETMLPI